MRCVLILCLIATAGARCNPGGQCDSGSAFIQRRSVNKRMEPVEEKVVSWTAGAFDKCTRSCNGQAAFESRKLSCQSMDGEEQPHDVCQHLPKPALHRPCSCTLSLCGAKCEDVEVANLNVDPDGQFECLGCYPLSDAEKSLDDVMDDTCIHHNTDEPCNGGLPFFRMKSNSVTVGTCYAFCLGNGLDLFGLTAGGECRCGASRLNKAVWRDAKPRPGLELPKPRGSCTMEEQCPLRVYRWLGPFASGGVPEHLQAENEEQNIYIQSVARGKQVLQEEDTDHSVLENEDGQLEGALAEPEALLQNEAPWDRLCNDNPGCNAGKPWTDRVSAAPEGVVDRWEDYVVIPYYFMFEGDSTRREAFRAAAKMWMDQTCIVFKEYPDDTTLTPILKAKSASSGCSATLGKTNSGSTVKMGWCNSITKKGNIAHEIGHAMGAHHTMKRADAGEAYEGHGPHLKVYWENVASSWVNQYTAAEKAYVGSAKDLEGDAQAGLLGPLAANATVR
ncbi:unnamed protein product [Effrenium voratum]|uniref:Peptidase M12A domain-containing protein n=1 Tax=Effrenium voratum TaxID=2562239 RepID=A0AA36N9N3_9DINO|nr:unnamed protein product [Effrenium voratum]